MRSVADLAVAVPVAAPAVSVAALEVEAATAGRARATPRAKVLPGLERWRVCSTKAARLCWRSFRPRERRCLTASSERSRAAATCSMDCC
ncbi:MAG: hypothetical protein ACTHN5_13760 [Phycisphaerae bacterium]